MIRQAVWCIDGEICIKSIFWNVCFPDNFSSGPTILSSERRYIKTAGEACLAESRNHSS